MYSFFVLLFAAQHIHIIHTYQHTNIAVCVSICGLKVWTDVVWFVLCDISCVFLLEHVEEPL